MAAKAYSSIDSYTDFPPMIIWVSITKYNPNKRTPTQQYRFSRKGEDVNIVIIAKISKQTVNTIIIPNEVVKSYLVVQA